MYITKGGYFCFACSIYSSEPAGKEGGEKKLLDLTVFLFWAFTSSIFFSCVLCIDPPRLFFRVGSNGV